MRTAIILTAALFLCGCVATGKDISVAEYSAHMKTPFDKLKSYQKRGGAEIVVIGESRERERRLVGEAVQAINAVLPSCATLKMGEPNSALSWKAHVSSKGKLSRSATNAGKIYIEFMSHGFRGGSKTTKAGTSWGRYIQVKRTDDHWRKYSDDGKFREMIAHELAHSIGIWGHVPASVRSLMHAGYGGRYHIPGLFSKSDRAALAHLYPC